MVLEKASINKKGEIRCTTATKQNEGIIIKEENFQPLNKTDHKTMICQCSPTL